jgi:aminopeptidase N
MISLRLKVLILFLTISFSSQSQGFSFAEPTRVFSLDNMDLDILPDFEEKTILGTAKLTLTPFRSSQNKISLDAQFMVIHKVEMNSKSLEFNYDGKKLSIELGKSIAKGESFEIVVEYTARPNRAGKIDSSKSRGFYFMDSKTAWTDGITNSNSIWFPTIDEPNQRMTQRIAITVPKELLTVSNGVLEKQVALANSKRKDIWVLDSQHAPYLAFLAIGDYKKITISKQTGKPSLSYYVSPDFADVSSQVFEHTGEIISFFESQLGVEFPYQKFDQIVLKGFDRKAQGNTTIAAYFEEAYQNEGQLSDENLLETKIARSVFQQWFGDFVGPESWSNIALSTAFSTYAEYLWLEYKYGREKADLHLHDLLEEYMDSDENRNAIINKEYRDSYEVFDKVNFNKGAIVVHMLRLQIGDEDFFSSLKLYLQQNALGKTELAEFRLAVEQVTGQDFNWFFDQWFYGEEYPKIQVDVDFNILDRTFSVSVKQLTKVYQFPLEINIYESDKIQTELVWVDTREKSMLYPYNEIPDLITVNESKSLLAEIYQTRTPSQQMFQALYAQNPIDQVEALKALKDRQEDPEVFKVFASSIESEEDIVVIYALENINLAYKTSKRSTINYIESLVDSNRSNFVRAAAVELLGKLVNPEYFNIFKRALSSDSNAILTQALTAMYYIDQDAAFEAATNLPDDTKTGIAYPLVTIYITEKNTSEMSFVASYLIDGMYLIRDKEMKKTYEEGFDWVIKSNNTKAIKNLCESIVDKSMNYASYGFKGVGIDLLRQIIAEQYKLDYDNREEIVNVVSAALNELVTD